MVTWHLLDLYVIFLKADSISNVRRKYTRRFSKRWVKIPTSKVKYELSHRRKAHKYAVSQISNQTCIHLLDLAFKIKLKK